MGKRYLEEDFGSPAHVVGCQVLPQNSGGKRLRASRDGMDFSIASTGAAQAAVLGIHQAPATPSVQPTITAETWCCFDELNVLLQARNPSFSEVVLRSYHSFTRATKPLVFAKLAQASVGGSTNALQQLPLHLQLVSFVLERMCAEYEQATICSYTFSPPDWLQPWCVKWGVLEPSVTILGVTCYPQPSSSYRSAKLHTFPGGESSSYEEPARTIYVPAASTC